MEKAKTAMIVCYVEWCKDTSWMFVQFRAILMGSRFFKRNLNQKLENIRVLFSEICFKGKPSGPEFKHFKQCLRADNILKFHEHLQTFTYITPWRCDFASIIIIKHMREGPLLASLYVLLLFIPFYSQKILSVCRASEPVQIHKAKARSHVGKHGISILHNTK